MHVKSGILKDKKAIKDVQKLALKLVTSKWDSGHDELLQLAELKPLEERCVELKLGLLIHNLCFFPGGSVEFRNCRITGFHCLSNSLFLLLILILTSIPFFPHTSSTWNMLDESCIS